MAETDKPIVEQLAENTVTDGAQSEQIAALETRVSELESRVAAAENASHGTVLSTDDDARAVINKLHMALYGVPAGELQSLG